MTELCVAFFTQPEDTPEQVTATVGTLASHVEVSVNMCKCMCVSVSV